MKKVLVPRVRFKGFSEEWKEEKFGELLFRINEKGYEWLETLTASKSGEMLKRKSINYHIQVAKESLKNYNRVLKNDFVLHLSTYESGLAYSKEIGITSPAYDVLRFFDKNNNDPIFFKYVFSNKKFINSLVPFTYGLRQGKSINLEELNKSLIEKTNISEQQKIGKLLENIDNLITLEEIKLNKLKQLKQTLLQKMFPEGNSKTPRIRFKGFSKEWKEEKLEYIAKVTNGKSNTSDNNKWGQYNLYIRSEEIYKSNKYIFDVEGVITVGDGNIGKIFHYVNGKFDLHQRCYLIYEFQNIWPKYFYYYFSQNFYKRAILMSYTATVNSIRMNTITDMDIMFPKELIEQQKIGDFFSKISNLISLYNSKLNKLKQIKDALLQKMFI